MHIKPTHAGAQYLRIQVCIPPRYLKWDMIHVAEVGKINSQRTDTTYEHLSLRRSGAINSTYIGLEDL
jgi:hypothetical protein